MQSLRHCRPGNPLSTVCGFRPLPVSGLCVCGYAFFCGRREVPRNSKSGRMAQGVKVLASKPDDLSLIPGTKTTGGNQLTKVVLYSPHLYWGAPPTPQCICWYMERQRVWCGDVWLWNSLLNKKLYVYILVNQNLRQSRNLSWIKGHNRAQSKNVWKLSALKAALGIKCRIFY